MRRYLSGLTSFMLAAAVCTLGACSSSKSPSGDAGQLSPSASTASSDSTAPVTSLKARSPHNVMVALAGGTALTRDQQAYAIALQDRISAFWQPEPAKLKYTVGLEFTVNRNGMVTNILQVSSMGNRRAVENCRQAIQNAAGRFDALPAEFKDAPQTFMCEFMYNPSDK